MKRIYWGDWAIGVLGGVLIGNLFTASGVEIVPSPAVRIIIVAVIGVVLVLYVLSLILLPRKLTNQVDERTVAQSDRSARNGLLAIYLGLLVLVIITSLDTMSLLAVAAASLAVYCVSVILYRHRPG